MKPGRVIGLAIVVIAWVGLCVVLLSRVEELDGMTLFSIVASGIIIFVPLYKRYFKSKD